MNSIANDIIFANGGPHRGPQLPRGLDDTDRNILAELAGEGDTECRWCGLETCDEVGGEDECDGRYHALTAAVRLGRRQFNDLTDDEQAGVADVLRQTRMPVAGPAAVAQAAIDEAEHRAAVLAEQWEER